MSDNWRTGSSLLFIDTNILFYAYDADSGDKHGRAIDALEICFRSRRGRLSIQVLQEFSATLWRRLKISAKSARINELIRPYMDWDIHMPAPANIFAANSLAEKRHLSFWDAMILVSAQASGASWLLSEDLQHGQTINGVRIWNPLVNPG